MIIVSDTSPITNLAAIGKLDLLHSLFGYILIPAEVCGEMVGVGKVVPGTKEVQELSWITTKEVVDQQWIADILDNEENIDVGEAAALVLALETKADVLLMDERRGRAVAAEYGIKVVGLLGILLQAKERGLISAVKPVMEKLITEASFRVSSSLYKTVLQAASEDSG